MNVWFIASEVAPFAKTGGLADVAGSLPAALSKEGVKVSVGLPFYREVEEQHLPLEKAFSCLKVPFGQRDMPCDVLTTTWKGIPTYFFRREDLFNRPNLYATPEGDYYDNLERFAYFSRAALCFAREMGERVDVIHVHDWQTGLVPAYLKAVYRGDPFFSNTKTVFTIHNIGYQGVFPADKLPACGLPLSEFNPEGAEYWGHISLLKAGIVYADAITTVSPRHSREIQTSEFGMGMEGILRKRASDLYGILNGVDYTAWNPQSSRDLRFPYDPIQAADKHKNKAALLGELGIDRRFSDRPVLAMISRLAAQKGWDLLFDIIGDVFRLNVSMVVLGRGEYAYASALSSLGGYYPGAIAVNIGYDDATAHRILAGADMFLAPSRYEPCGLAHLYALRFGAVPVVHATGGLDDTVEQFNLRTGRGTGFKFSDYRALSFLNSVRRAVKIYDDRPAWQAVVRNGMNADFSWEESARRYIALYKKLTGGLNVQEHTIEPNGILN
jgi:starch synthase